MSRMVIEGFDEQISCHLRRINGEVVLRGCPFFKSAGHGDGHCLLLMCMESERLQKGVDGEEIVWNHENLQEEIFKSLPKEQQSSKALCEWKFPNCPLHSASDFVNRTEVHNAVRDVFDKFNFSFEDSKPGGLGHAVKEAINNTSSVGGNYVYEGK